MDGIWISAFMDRRKNYLEKGIPHLAPVAHREWNVVVWAKGEYDRRSRSRLAAWGCACPRTMEGCLAIGEGFMCWNDSVGNPLFDEISTSEG